MSDYYNFDGKDFQTDEELNAFIQETTDKFNKKPIDDFCGLSPEHMFRLMHYPFDSPEIVKFKTVLDMIPTAPIATLFNGIIDAIGTEGAKCTAKGNLPKKAVNQIADKLKEEFKDPRLSPRKSIPSEFDFDDLYVTRFIAQKIGLIRKYRGKFFLTKKCNDLLAGNGMKEVYPILLRAFAKRLVWSCRDGYSEINLIQDSFAYSLFLLDRFGNKKRKVSYYQDAFMKAFPMVVDEIEPSRFFSNEDVVRNSYSIRFIDRFACFLGLVEGDSKLSPMTLRDPSIRSTPLLSSAINFKVP